MILITQTRNNEFVTHEQLHYSGKCLNVMNNAFNIQFPTIIRKIYKCVVINIITITAK